MILSRRLGLPFLAAFIVFLAPVGSAQADSQCTATVQALWTTASSACITGPDGYVCNGGSAPFTTPTGAISNALSLTGALVEVTVVESLQTSAIDTNSQSGGIMWLRLPAPLSATMLLVGAVSVQNVTPDNFPPWTSTLVMTGGDVPECAAAPLSTLVLQNTVPGQPSRLVINGASLSLNGTVLVRTSETSTEFIALSGQSAVTVLGVPQPLLTGHQVRVHYQAGDLSRPVDMATPPTAFDPSVLQNLPVVLFPRPVVLPQPGFVRTQGQVNLRSGPSQHQGLIMAVPPGEVMSVLGANPAGDWYHVQLDSGETGWMLAELLQREGGPVMAVYEATPMLPQRVGELGTGGRVAAPAGLNLRQGPGPTFPVVASVGNGALVQILARSPYSQWVKVDANGTIGWVPLMSLETQAYYEAMPVDYSVGPPPPPTRVPGTFGNAFPEPGSGG